MNEVLLTMIAGGGGVLGGWLGTIIANKTDIDWLKKEMGRIEAAVTRAHSRIDQFIGK